MPILAGLGLNRLTFEREFCTGIMLSTIARVVLTAKVIDKGLELGLWLQLGQCID